MSIAYECETGNCMHVTDEHCIVEIIDDFKQPVDNDQGLIVVTNLDNYVMPFIRYETMDIGKRYNEPCRCGRNHTAIASIEGRISDLIKGTSGNIVHGEFFTHLLEEFGWFEKYQISDFEAVQESINELCWRFVLQIRPNNDAELALYKQTINYLGDMHIRFEYLSAIPKTAMGKRRFTRCLFKTNSNPEN